MSAWTVPAPGKVALGAALAAAVAAVTSEFWAPPVVSRRPDTMLYQPYAGNDAAHPAVVCFPGMHSEASQYAPMLPIIGNDADVLLAVSGSDARVTARQAVDELTSVGLHVNHGLVLVGLSAGSLTLVDSLRYCWHLGIEVSAVVIVSGPGSSEAPIWPSERVRQASRLLQGGPMSAVLLRYLRNQELANISRRLSTGEITLEQATADRAEVMRRRRIPTRNVATRAAMLRRGPALQPGEFSDIPTLIIEKVGDGVVANCFEAWQRGFPLAEHQLIADPRGHVKVGECLPLYRDVVRGWLMRQGLLQEDIVLGV